MTKLRYVPGLSRAVQRMMQHIKHTSRKVAGCQETWRQMRFDTHALRVKYGVSIFITYSPDEAHNLLMVRLSKTRRSDPVLSVDESASKYVGRDEPNIIFDETGDVRLDIPMEELIDKLPAWDERRRILARDPLASVDGFWISILLVHEHVFGMRICPRCPDCNQDGDGVPCQDLFGSNATAEGGSFSRMDAVATSIEAQKSTGSLHGHTQGFVQGVHQHTPLWEVLTMIRSQRTDLVPRFLRYKAHVSRQMYADTNGIEHRLLKKEAAWPEYKDTASLLLFPQYMARDHMTAAFPAQDRQSRIAPVVSRTAEVFASLSGVEEEGRLWQVQRQRHVQNVQEHKLRRIHILNEITGERIPLAPWRRADNPQLRKR